MSLAAGVILAESEPVSHEYTGDVVNARCLPAAEIVSRNSRGFSPSAGINSFAGARYKPLNTLRLRGKILDTCRLNPGVTEFALVLENGNFFKLDDAGNRAVMRLRIPIESEARVNVSGSVDREFLRVDSVSKVPTKQ
jgi:hypothetical protein